MLAQRRAPSRIPLISVISGLSHALDLTEGHPLGHANRSCIIGMRIAQALGLPADQQTNLHHALLLKDAGCSSNAQRVHELFGGDDREVKRAVWLRDWRRFTEQVSYALQYTERRGSLLARMRKLMVLAAKGPRGGGRALSHPLRSRRADRPGDGLSAPDRRSDPIDGRALGRLGLSRRPAQGRDSPRVADHQSRASRRDLLRNRRSRGRARNRRAAQRTLVRSRAGARVHAHRDAARVLVRAARRQSGSGGARRCSPRRHPSRRTPARSSGSRSRSRG